MKRPLVRGILAAVLAGAPACRIIINYEAKEAADASTDASPFPGTEPPTVPAEPEDAATPDAPASTGNCPVTTKGPRLVEVKTPTGESMCVDETEVTQGQYRAFTAEVTALREQPTECSWNTDIKPNAACANKLDDGDASPYLCLDRAARCDDAPQTCVDWCDAFYYCKWAGKRLCGKIGGGTVPSTEGANPAVSQWVNACSSSGKRKYPYEGAFNPEACYIHADAGYPTLPAKSYPGCVTPSGAFDMSGSVAEWEDSCASRDGASDICVYRGGSFLTDPEPVLFECARQQGRARALAAKWRGFRCCFP